MIALPANNIINSKSFPREIRANELISLLDRYTGKIKILSLDCFDTLLWRKTATPTDVFYDLQHQPTFKSLGFNARLRSQSETLARQKMQLVNGKNEVTLKNIYQAHFHALEDHQLQALMDEELAAEMETCYAFFPILELMEEAANRGLKIIIVSDTYLNETQLRTLLNRKLPQHIMEKIKHVFCSCEHGLSKSRGLFKPILEKLHTSPASVLHIGDNQVADVNAALALGLHAVKLVHHHPEVAELMRMQALSGSFIDPAIRNTRSLPNPFRGLLAIDSPLNSTPENIIGYATVGPILYAFAKFIQGEIEKMQKNGKRPKVLFLMRDAYLPSLVCEALAGKEIGYRVRISRFTAFAASFRQQDDIDRYLAERIKSEKFDTICKQLLLTEEVTQKILQQTKHAKDPILEFNRQIHRPVIMQLIVKQSAAYRARFMRYLQNEIGLESGDTLMFVDLGYTGTAQIKLAPIFKEEMNIDVFGCYLISMPTPQHEVTRAGLLDTTHYDDHALIMLVTYIALLEQICTSSDHSVIDYDHDGHAIYAENNLPNEQHQKLVSLQAECLRFAQDAEKIISQHEISAAMLRDAAAINLCRLLFLPLQSELDYLQTFRFDFNLGTEEILPIFDMDKGLTSLRRRGWLHSAKDNLSNMRTNYPAEWRSAGIELALTLMSQHRFGLEFALTDLSHRREKLPIIIFEGKEPSSLDLQAVPTHDGYFSILIPVANTHCALGIWFGSVYQWVEIESAELIQLNKLYSSQESEHSRDASDYMQVNEMAHKGGGLFECLSQNGLLMFDPANKIGQEKSILRVIFRPLVRQGSNISLSAKN